MSEISVKTDISSLKFSFIAVFHLHAESSKSDMFTKFFFVCGEGKVIPKAVGKSDFCIVKFHSDSEIFKVMEIAVFKGASEPYSHKIELMLPFPLYMCNIIAAKAASYAVDLCAAFQQNAFRL